MFLAHAKRIPGAEVLITVKTYPQPYTSHGENVCTAGVMKDGRWIRIHPVPFRMEGYNQFEKYHWIRLDLKKNKSDKRPESYVPESDHEILDKVDTKDGWRIRRELVLGNVYHSFAKLMEDAYGNKNVSLAVVKPIEVLDFTWENTDRDWSEKWKSKWLQKDLFFDLDESKIVQKVPYNFYYVFLTEGDSATHRISITDWEVGALYWNCLKRSNGNEDEALQKVKHRFFTDLALKRDLYFFVGSHYVHHVRRLQNPFMIVGVFYPPHIPEEDQLSFDFT